MSLNKVLYLQIKNKNYKMNSKDHRNAPQRRDRDEDSKEFIISILHMLLTYSFYTRIFPAEETAFATVSSLASSGNNISLWAHPDGIIGKQFSK